MNNFSISQETFVFSFLRSKGITQKQLASKLSTSKQKIHQPEISRALRGRDPVILKMIIERLKIPVGGDGKAADQ